MPEVSRFYGVVVKMRYRDHPPPHFHAEYGEYELAVGIMPIIQGVEVEPEFTLRVTFADGVSGIIRLRDAIQQGGVFARLADPAVFAQVSVGDRGRSLEWPGQIDLCADALWLEIQSSNSRRRMTLSQP
jgi:hypothetical protein